MAQVFGGHLGLWWNFFVEKMHIGSNALFTLSTPHWNQNLITVSWDLSFLVYQSERMSFCPNLIVSFLHDTVTSAPICDLTFPENP